MSQQRVLLPNRLMGSSAALTEGKSLGQAGGVLPCSGQTTPEGWAWQGAGSEGDAPSEPAPRFLKRSGSAGALWSVWWAKASPGSWVGTGSPLQIAHYRWVFFPPKILMHSKG